ncbi:NUP-domain-containing protein [Rhizodiscina lignyota]|uniref:NUP-domain-containing protein n=1 Tax=Rhizodiscina lignyota TaxID=1504668 RepID=A0A9P4IN51_9PEZI|nr:NUP-domain-containing protein [Rhizodiscina lignyota]
MVFVHLNALAIVAIFLNLACHTTGFTLQSLWPNALITSSTITPKIMIVGFYPDEQSVWEGIPEFDIFGQNITVPGLSSQFPQVHCTKEGDVCQMLAGEGEINAASSITAVAFSPLFDFRTTYFMIAGVAGINPEIAGIGSVTFAQFVTQPALQYEFDAREKPENYTTGYVPQGSQFPSQYPSELYGTECYEVNARLKSLAVGFAKTAQLNDTAAAARFRATYRGYAPYAAGTTEPGVYECDAATADVYVSGRLLSEAWQNYTHLITNGTGKYCTTLQEDSGVLEALLRADLAKRADFARAIVMRTGSDYDRQAPETSPIDNLYFGQDGYTPALNNIYLAGVKVVQGILMGWERTFKRGITPENYVGDILGSLGGRPDFGPGSIFTMDGESGTTQLMRKRGRGQLRGRRRPL